MVKVSFGINNRLTYVNCLYQKMVACLFFTLMRYRNFMRAFLPVFVTNGKHVDTLAKC